MPEEIPPTELNSALSRVAGLESKLRAVESERDQLRGERDKLREAWQAVKFELELLKKRLFIAKAERVDVEQLELEFAQKLAELDALSKRLEPVPPWMMATVPGESDPGARQPDKKKTGGRRDLRELELDEVRIELADPVTGIVTKQLGYEESYQLAWRKGGFVRVVVARRKHEQETSASEQLEGAGPTLWRRPERDPLCGGLGIHSRGLTAAA